MIKKALIYLSLIVGAVIAVFPFFWMLVSSFKTAAEISATPPTVFPSIWTLENYVYAFRTAPFATYFVNSVIVTVSSIGLTGFTTILAAFAFSRLRFRGRDIIFALMLGLMMIPFEMLMITNFSTIVTFGLHDTIAALILPFTASIFYTFLLRNSFMSIPDSLYHSARVDGASNWLFLWRVMVPMSSSSIVTIMLLNAIVSWNTFIWPFLVINSISKRTLPFGLFAFITEGGVRYERLMAGAAITVLPVIILFLFARRKIVTGMARGGVKG